MPKQLSMGLVYDGNGQPPTNLIPGVTRLRHKVMGLVIVFKSAVCTEGVYHWYGPVVDVGQSRFDKGQPFGARKELWEVAD